MNYNKLSHCILSLLLSIATLLFCSCNKNPMSVMASGVSDVASKNKVDRYINSDGGFGEVVENPELIVREELRRCQNEERSLSVELKFAKKNLQSEKENSEKCLTSLQECEIARKFSDDMQSAYQKENERCEKKLEELGKNSTTMQGHFESQLANLESQIASLEKNHTEYITTLNKSKDKEISTIKAQLEDQKNQTSSWQKQYNISQEEYNTCLAAPLTRTTENYIKEITTLKAQKVNISTQLAAEKNEKTLMRATIDEMLTQLEAEKNRTRSCQDDYDKVYAERTQELTQLNPIVKLGFGGSLFVAVVSTAGWAWSWKTSKQKNAEIAAKLDQTEEDLEKEKSEVIRLQGILKRTNRQLIQLNRTSNSARGSENSSLRSNLMPTTVRNEGGRSRAGITESLNENE